MRASGARYWRGHYYHRLIEVGNFPHFFCSCLILCDESQRVPTPLWQPAARQPSPAVGATRPQPPELARPGDDAARPARVRRRSTSELGGRGRAVASLTTRRKVSRSRGDSGKDRPRHHAEAARVHAAEILIRAQRPPAAPSVNISLRVLAYGAVSATGW